ncbi:MAG: hypothetical protein ACYC5A_00655 [Thermoleophilia bacterium]
MKSTWKLRIVAIMAGALALVLILGASMGTAAAPDPTLADDLLAMGDAGNSRVRIIDVDAQAVVNDITGPDVQGNHGTQWDGRYIWTANAGQTSPGTMKVVKLDTVAMGQAAAFQYSVGGAGGLCGIEWDRNIAGSNLWVTSMGAGIGSNGIFEVNPVTGFTSVMIDTGIGADNRATCGIGWDSTGTIAVASLMPAMKTTELNWPAGTTTGRQAGDGSAPGDAHSATLHILDTAKVKGYALVSAGAANGVGSAVDVVDLATMNVVGKVNLNGYNPHSVSIAHNEGFAYSHSRGVSGGQPASIIVYDIGGGTAGGTITAPVVIGTIPNGGGAGSCGVDVTVKSDYCAKPALSLSSGAAYWASMADYTARNLSVPMSIANGSGANVAAHNVAVTGASNTNGVTLLSNTAIANIEAGGSSGFTAVYLVPGGVSYFKTALSVTADDLCGNAHSYGGGLPT